MRGYEKDEGRRRTSGEDGGGDEVIKGKRRM